MKSSILLIFLNLGPVAAYIVAPSGYEQQPQQPYPVSAGGGGEDPLAYQNNVEQAEGPQSDAPRPRPAAPPRPAPRPQPKPAPRGRVTSQAAGQNQRIAVKGPRVITRVYVPTIIYIHKVSSQKSAQSTGQGNLQATGSEPAPSSQPAAADSGAQAQPDNAAQPPADAQPAADAPRGDASPYRYKYVF
ncbi:hypothetical protein Y032_0015g2823 [Ancylostoma ceylanicum]|nr:hypothetical protein Y032_0015g2823 [Ancylostoma ceylanicum]